MTMIGSVSICSKYTVISKLLLIGGLLNICHCDDNYLRQRENLLESDSDEFMGANLHLTEDEYKVDQYLLQLKKSELNYSVEFLPGENFLMVKEKIDKSKVFQFIQQIPKGASLHTHLLAAVDVNYIIEKFTYEDNVYGCCNDLNVFKLRILQDPKQDGNCSWQSLKTYRIEFKKRHENFDDFLRSKLALNARSLNQTRRDVWTDFKNTFSSLYDLVSYRRFFQKYIFRLLEELYADNIIYTELRGSFMPLYDLNGTTYDIQGFLDTFIETVEDFKRLHPDFVGVKYIHSIFRGVSDATLKTALGQLIHYKSLYPEFIAGMDFVGLEEHGKPLVDFHNELLDVRERLKFFFHAGETNEYGNTDLNIADAILLNSTRIGHAFALPKHPKLMQLVKDRDIAIELCTISNQVLRLNENPRNHPASVLLSKGFPVVIGNDDPAVWNATGLSYDWYTVLMAMTPEDQGLKFLKKVALNSINYSAMNATEKPLALDTWNEQWNRFIRNFANDL